MDESDEILTPEQAAERLQLDRETIYRYIRQGKLVASRLGRTYRIPAWSLDLLLWETRTRADIPLRMYTGDELTAIFEAERSDEEDRRLAEKMKEGSGKRKPRRS